ncbi:MAG: proprotein convertase P-domain-containing protein [bacterium]
MRLSRNAKVVSGFILLMMYAGTLQAGERLRNCAVTQSYPIADTDATINFPSSAVLLEGSQLVAGAARRNGNTDPGKIYLYNASSNAIQDSADQNIDAEVCRGQLFGETMVRLSDESNPGNRFAVFDPSYCEAVNFGDQSGRGYIYEVVNGQFNLLQTLQAPHEGNFEFGTSVAYSDGYLFVSGPGPGLDGYIAIYLCDETSCNFVTEIRDSDLPADTIDDFGRRSISADVEAGVLAVNAVSNAAVPGGGTTPTGIVLIFDISDIMNPVKINRFNSEDYPYHPSIFGAEITFGNDLKVSKDIVQIGHPATSTLCRNSAGGIRLLDIDTGDLLGSVEYNCNNEPFVGNNNMRYGTWFTPVGSASMVTSVGGFGTDDGTLLHYDYNPISHHSNYPNLGGVNFDPLLNGTNTTPVTRTNQTHFDTAFYPETKKYSFAWSEGAINGAAGNAYVLECDAPTDMLVDIPPGTVDTTEVFKSDPAAAISGGAPITDDLMVLSSNTYLWDINLSIDIINAANPNAPVKDTAELDIKLTSPSGTTVTISSGNGATGAFFSTYFDDSAISNNTVTDATYGGYNGGHAETPLMVESALGAFIGEDPNGTWTIEVVDTAPGGPVATLNSWGLEIKSLDKTPDATSVSASSTANSLISDSAAVTDQLSVSTLGKVICDVDLNTNITHTFSADLDINLKSPQGTIVTITTDNGSDFDDVFNGTLWDDSASENATDFVYANSVVATSLVPEGAMSAFNGEDPNGNWSLFITDDTAGNDGTLVSWGLDIKTCAAGAPVAANDSLTTDEDTILSGNVLLDNGNGADFDPDMDTLTIIEMNGSSVNVGMQSVLPSQALVTLNSDGTLVYNPNNQFEYLASGATAVDTFTYTVSDGMSAVVGTVSLTINGRNDAPYLVTNHSGRTVAGVSLIDNSRLAADDPDDDASGLTFTVTSPASNGELQLNGSGPTTTFTQDDINNNRLRYVHDGSSTVTDSFQFSLADGGEDGVAAVTGIFEINVDVIFYDGFE